MVSYVVKIKFKLEITIEKSNEKTQITVMAIYVFWSKWRISKLKTVDYCLQRCARAEKVGGHNNFRKRIPLAVYCVIRRIRTAE